MNAENWITLALVVVCSLIAWAITSGGEELERRGRERRAKKRDKHD